MQFFSSDKRLQEIFFQNHPPPPLPPSRVKWSAPKIKLLGRNVINRSLKVNILELFITDLNLSMFLNRNTYL